MAESSTITREVESAARAIAKALGQDFDTLPSMTFDPGSFCQGDFIRAAKAAGPVYGSKRRPYYGAACLDLDGMGANLRLSDGSLELVFKDGKLEQTNEEGRDLYISRLAGSEVIALRQWLIDYLPASEVEISVGHGVMPPVSVTVPAPDSEERSFWLEAASQHGFEATSGGEQIPEYDPPAYFATENEVLKLMAAARGTGAQGRARCPCDGRCPMSDAPREARSFETIQKVDLERLAQIAVASFEDLFDRREKSRIHRGRLRLLCLCQGAALHLRDGSRGIHDFDVWGFFEPHPEGSFPPRWTPEADFGPSRFGKTPNDQEREGRKVDVWGRSIEFRSDETAIDAVRRWISTGAASSPRFIRQRPVIVISPGPDFGTWIWPDVERWSGVNAE